MMKPFAIANSMACLLVAVCLQSPAEARNTRYYVGNSSAEQAVSLEMGSIMKASSQQTVNFVYYLDNERIESRANCPAGTWTTFPEAAVQRPQSAATCKMLDIVCRVGKQKQAGMPGVGFVIDPPSNVRYTPNGRVICTVEQRSRVQLYGSDGEWYYTDVCGTIGLIHRSQLEF